MSVSFNENAYMMHGALVVHHAGLSARIQFDHRANQILKSCFEQLWDLELDTKLRFRSIERFQRIDYYLSFPTIKL